MKIYASRDSKFPIEKYIGKDLWVRCHASNDPNHLLSDKFVKFTATSGYFKGKKLVWLVAFPYYVYEQALGGSYANIMHILAKVEDDKKQYNEYQIDLAIDYFVPCTPVEAYTSEELEDMMHNVIEENHFEIIDEDEEEEDEE